MANLIDRNLYDTIRNDTDIDSMLCLVSGYIGATEKRGDVDEN